MAVTLAVAGVPAADADPRSPRFTRLSVEDGLSQSSVQQILQDRRGLLWFGTQEGLNRYDGYRFTIHRSLEQPGFLHDHDIRALTDDARGNLWVGTSRGLYRYDLDTGRFDGTGTPVDGLGILELVRAGDGRIFFAASDGHLWMVDPAEADPRPRALRDGAFTALTEVSAVAPAQGSTIWVAARGRLLRVDVDAAAPGGQLTQVLADLGSVSVLAADARGDVWIGRVDGDLLRYRTADGTVERFPQAPRHTLAILPARTGDIWIGGRRAGLSRLDPNTGALVVYRHDPEDASSLASDDVAAIYEDAVGALWVGSWNGGVNRFDPHARGFRTLKHRDRVADSLPADDVTALTEMRDGTLWMASRSGIVGAGDPRSGRFRTVTTIPGRGRLTALGALDGLMFVGTARGLVMLDTSSGREVMLDASLRARGLGDRRIAAIRIVRDVGWIASGNELFRIRRGAARGPLRVDRVEVPIAGAVSAISAPAPDRLWIGSDSGEVVRAEWNDRDAAVMLRPLDIAESPERDSFAEHGFVSALHEDSEGRLWVGTRRGLGRVALASGTVAWLGQRDGLPSTNIAGIAADAAGRLWVGHNRGLTRMDPASGTMTHFGETDGAQGKGYAEGAWAAGGSGTLYFAGEGITAFDPNEVTVSMHRPRIVFTALEILHREVVPRWQDSGSPLERTITAEGAITLDPRATVFSVEMAPIHYADPASNRLMYRLEGFDPEWIETSSRNRVATYTNLPPGRYVLRARAGTKNGLWSEQDATLAIHLLPPWWRTDAALAGWFALAVAALGVAWIAARRRARVKVALLERDRLRRDSLTDPLTGLHNRRFLISWLEQEVPKLFREYRVKGPAAAATGTDLLLLLVDIDHFKAINDRYSHGAGDRVLARIAGVLREQIRGSDLAVRWGGDEFLLVTRSFDRERAADSAERLRVAVEMLGESVAAEGGPAVTASIGFAAFPFMPHAPDALTWEQTLELADHALRLTKRRRRNSYTGLRAAAGLTAAAVTDFLADTGNAPLPPAVKILVPEEGVSRPEPV